MATIRELAIRVTGDSTSYSKEMSKASATGGQFYSAMEGRAKRFDAYIAQNNRSIEAINHKLTTLGKTAISVAASFAGGFAATSILTLADDYGQMAARIKMSLQSVEGDLSNYQMVQDRLFETSIRNAKNLADSQELYIRSAESMKSLGYNTQQTVDFVESLSSAFTANATSSEKVQSTINALNKSFVSGKVGISEWRSIASALPNLSTQLALATGKSRQEIEQLGNTGKLSMIDLANGTILAKDAYNALADSMDNTIKDGFVQVYDAMQRWAGEANEANRVTQTISGGLKLIATNFDTIASAGITLIGVGAARYFGNLSTSVYQNTASIIANTKAKITNAQAQLESAQAARVTAVLTLKDAQAKYDAAVGTNQYRAASIALTRARYQEAASLTTVTAAQQRLNTVSITTGNTIRGLASGALGLIGGPMGAAMLAGGALYYFAQASQQAREDAIRLKDNVKLLADEVANMNNETRLAAAEQLRRQIIDQEDALKRLTESVNVAKVQIALYKKGELGNPFFDEQKAFGDIDILKKQILDAQEGLDKLNHERKLTIDVEYRKAFLGDSKPSDLPNISEVASEADALTKAYQAQLEMLDRQISSYQNLTHYQQLEIALSGDKLKGLDDELQKVLLTKAAEIDHLDEVKKQEAEREKAKQNALRELDQRQKSYNDLVLSLRTIEQQALDDLREKTELVNKMAKSEEERFRILKQIAEQTVTKAPQFNFSAYTGVGSDLINIAEQEKKLNDWHAKQLELQKSLLEQKTIAEQDYANNVIAINRQMNEQQNNMSKAYQMATLGVFSDMTGQIAEMFKETAGESSLAYKAMFLASKASAIAQAMISTEVAAAKALELGPIFGISASSLVRGLGYASVGLIASQTIAGMAHDGIDNIPHEGTWLLDKGERVVDARTNSDLKDYLNSSKSGGNLTITVPVNVSDGSVSEQDGKQLGQMIKQSVISVIQEQQRPGGILNRR